MSIPNLHDPGKGFLEGDGGVSIEAAHAARNTSVSGISWIEIPDYGKTLSGITPWPRSGNNYGNFTPGTGPSMLVFSSPIVKAF